MNRHTDTIDKDVKFDLLFRTVNSYSRNADKKWQSISEGQSNSKIDNKLTNPWLKEKKTNRQIIVQ